MSTNTRSRVDKGVTTGGQFAKENKSEDAAVSLTSAGPSAPTPGLSESRVQAFDLEKQYEQDASRGIDPAQTLRSLHGKRVQHDDYDGKKLQGTIVPRSEVDPNETSPEIDPHVRFDDGRWARLGNEFDLIQGQTEATEGGAAAQPFTNPNDLPPAPIRLKLQRWNGDEAETVEDIEVDGRTLLAGMSREDMDWHIENGPYNGATDEMLEWAQKDGLAKEWDGPFEFDVGKTLSDLQAQDPEILDQLSEARLDPSTYYSVGEDGQLRSAEETWEQDIDRQYDAFEKAREEVAYLQLRPFVQDFEKLYPDVAEVNFAHDGDEDDPLFVATITMKDGTFEVHDQSSLDGDYPVFNAGNAIETNRSYSFDEIRNFRPSR